MTQQLGTKQKQWIHELREGGWKQTVHALEDEGCYCCLGVGCLAVESESTKVIREFDDEIAGTGLDDQLMVLAAIGLHDGAGSAYGPTGRLLELDKVVTQLSGHLADSPTCIEMNDDYDLSFNQIADILTEYADLYFIEPR